jgi:hypothetical protein
MSVTRAQTRSKNGRAREVHCNKITIYHYYYAYVIRLRAGLSGVQIPAGARDFSLLHNVQTESGAHPVSLFSGYGGPNPGRCKRYLSSPHRLWGPTQSPIQWVPGAPGVNRQRREVDYSPPLLTEVKKNRGTIPPSPHMPSWLSQEQLYLITLPDVTALTVIMTSQAG